MEYHNFEDYEEEEDAEAREAETSFIDDDDDEFHDAKYDNDELLLYSRKGVKKDLLPFTDDEKRKELKKYFGDSGYSDANSRIFLDNLTFENDGTADNDILVKYKDVEIGTIDLDTKTVEKKFDNIKSSGYAKNHENVIKYRNSLLIGQIEETTGEQGFVNDLIADNIRKKFVIEMNKREGLKDPGEHIELNQLKEDFNRLDRGKKLETDLGREILDQQVVNTRRALEFRRLLEKIPAVGFLLTSVVGIITALISFAKGQFYSGAKNLQASKKKTKQTFDPIKEAQDLAANIMEFSGDNMEMLITIVTIVFILVRKKNRT